MGLAALAGAGQGLRLGAPAAQDRPRGPRRRRPDAARSSASGSPTSARRTPWSRPSRRCSSRSRTSTATRRCWSGSRAIEVDELTEVITDAWLDRAPQTLRETFLAAARPDPHRVTGCPCRRERVNARVKWHPDLPPRTLNANLNATGDPAPTRKDVCMPEEQPPVDPDHPRSGWSWSRPEAPGPAESAAPDAPPHGPSLPRNEDFRRTVGFTVLGTVVPGVGLIAAGRKVVGIGRPGRVRPDPGRPRLVAAVDRDALISVGVDPDVAAPPLDRARRGRGALGRSSSWRRTSRCGTAPPARSASSAACSSASWPSRSPRPWRWPRGPRTCRPAWSAPCSRARTRPKSATRPTLDATHPGDKEQQSDPWADKPRLNILLLGGDAGKGRVGTRTDTVILASIDTKTGDTTLFSLPRNTARMPFPSDSPLQALLPQRLHRRQPGERRVLPQRDVPRRARPRCRRTSSATPTTSAPT